MDTVAYFRSLTAEVDAVKNRVRDLIGDIHWPSDGGWKESVLRSVIRRYLPPKFYVGSGFVISDTGRSTQIDVLILDDRAPVLFREGDLVIVTPDAVVGVIEVKTRLGPANLREALTKLDAIAHLIRSQSRHPEPFFGLFAFEPSSVRPSNLLAMLREVNGDTGSYPINCIALGPRRFVRYWPFPPEGRRYRYSRWHAYDLDGIACGYFIHNVLESVFPDAFQKNAEIWYPVDGKESSKMAEIIRGHLHITTGPGVARGDNRAASDAGPV